MRSTRLRQCAGGLGCARGLRSRLLRSFSYRRVAMHFRAAWRLPTDRCWCLATDRELRVRSRPRKGRGCLARRRFAQNPKQLRLNTLKTHKGGFSSKKKSPVRGWFVLVKTPKRWLARLRLAARVCGNCRYFDLEAGQADLRNMPIFGEVIQHVPPQRIAGSLREGEEAIPPPQALDPRVRWSDFGLCTCPAHPDEARWKLDSCESWA